MAISEYRVGWLELFRQMRTPTSFGTRFFTLKQGSIYSGKEIAIDIKRYGEDVATVITEKGSNINDFKKFTTKTFTPPKYGEAFAIDVDELYKRSAGTDPFTAASISYASQMLELLMDGFMLVNDKIQRAIELQAWQILQTGMLTLTDSDGDSVYDLDFKPKPTHFPTVTTGWGTAGADPLGDLNQLAKVIRGDGKISPNYLLMGDTALLNFLNDEQVQKQMDNRRIDVGAINPRFDNSGSSYYGYIFIAGYRFDIWTYPQTYTDPQTKQPVLYLDDNKVVMLSDQTRLDMTSSLVSLPLGVDPRMQQYVPGRISSTEEGYDLTTNAWATPEGTDIFGGLYTRTLLIPTQIDGFGCLNTQP